MKTKDLYDEYMITSMVPGFEPVEVERASGTTFYDADGNSYLDCFSGISVTNAGHSHPKIVSAAKEQMDRLIHCCTYMYYNPRAGELAKLCMRDTATRARRTLSSMWVPRGSVIQSPG